MDIMRENKHLTLKGVKDIVAIKTSFNKGLSDNKKAAFPDIVPYIRPDLINKKKYLIRSGWEDLYLVKGVFMLVLKNKVGFQVILEFSIS